MKYLLQFCSRRPWRDESGWKTVTGWISLKTTTAARAGVASLSRFAMSSWQRTSRDGTELSTGINCRTLLVLHTCCKKDMSSGLFPSTSSMWKLKILQSWKALSGRFSHESESSQLCKDAVITSNQQTKPSESALCNSAGGIVLSVIWRMLS